MFNLNSIKSETLVYIILTAFCLIVYITGLFPETAVDSAKYAALSRGVFESGDLIHLKIHGEPYLHKPPLLFWLGALSFSIFGVSIFAFKLPALLYSFLGIFSVYRLGSLIHDKRTGIIGAILYASNESFFLYNADLHTDLLLTTNIIFATWQLAEYLDRKKAINFILGFAGVGLAMLSKGAIGLAIPVFAIGGYLIMKKDFRELFSLKWLAGIPVLLIILFPYFKGLYDHFGMEGFKFYFWSNNVDRIQGEYSGGRHDYFFFLHTLAYVILPWSVFVFTVFIKDCRQWKNKGFLIENKKVVYCYSPLIILGLIISISSQQAPHYLLPVIPFASILAARLISEISFTGLYPKTLKLMLVFRTIVVVLLWPLPIIMIVYFFPTGNLLIWLTVALSLILLIYSYIRLRSAIQKLIIPPLVTILLMSFVANTVYLPSAIKYHGVIQASFLFNRLAADDSKLYTYDYFQYETYFYPKNVSALVYPGQLNNALSDGPCWFITSEKGYSEIESTQGVAILEMHSFPFRQLRNLSLQFMNPKTRESSLEKIYLLKIR